MIGDICDYIEKIDEIRISLSRGLILVNREIEDELHYMEFNDLNAAMGWASYRRLKELRRKRREIKDAIDLLAQASPVLRPLDLTNILTLKRYIESRSTRSYQLRAPDQFFEEHPELQKKAREKVEENEKTSD